MRAVSVSLMNLHLALLNEQAGNYAKADEIYKKATEKIDKTPLRMVRATGTFLERRNRATKQKLYEAYLKAHPASYLMGYELGA